MAAKVDSWNKKVFDIKIQVESDMECLGVPVVHGIFNGDSAVKIEIAFPDISRYKLLIIDGSICVVEIGHPYFRDDINNLHIYIRLGFSCTWLSACLCAPEDFLEETDIDGIDDKYESLRKREAWLEDSQRDVLAVRLANEPGFGLFRNQDQRFEFARDFFQKVVNLDYRDHIYWDITRKAETIYELGVLPRAVKSLVESGKSLSQVASELCITKQRAERAFNMDIPSNILRIL